MKVLNLFAGPGAGKSTTAAGLFHKLKLAGHNCEYVHEQAKNFTWEKRSMTLACQPYVFAKQMRDIWRLRDQVDLVICDSPLLLSLVYGDRSEWPESFFKYAIDQFHQFDNLNFLIERVKPYKTAGRNQTEAEARVLDQKIREILLDNLGETHIIRGDEEAVGKIFQIVSAEFQKNS